MTYDEFVTQEFIPRALTTWGDMKGNLVTAGLPANAVTIEEVTTEGVNDLRYRITARKGNREVVGFIELTNAGIINGAMHIAVTLYVEGNGSQITTVYSSGTAVPYNDSDSLLGLVTKLMEIDGISKTDLITAVRAALQV